MILVAIAVILATSLGVLCEHRTPQAERAARLALTAMLYALLPVIAYANFAHLSLTLGAGIGLILAYLGVGAAGGLAWAIGRRLELDRASLGAIVCTTVVVNTGYLGLPIISVTLGSRALAHGVAFDQIVSAPMTFVVGFAVGAAFGTHGSESPLARAKALVTRNPPLIGAIAGLLVPAAWAPQALLSASHVVVVALLPVGFFAVGVYLSSERREDAAPLLELPDARVGVAMALRFGVTPALLALARLLGVGIPSAYFIQAAMPAGVTSLIIAHAFGLDQRLVASIIVWSTIIVLLAATIAYLV